MTDSLRAFLTDHKDLIEKEDYSSLYRELSLTAITRKLTSELTSLLVSCGAEPWIDLEVFPPNLISSVQGIESIVVTKKTKTIQSASLARCPSVKSIIFNTTFEKFPTSCCNDNPEVTSITGHGAKHFGEHCFSNCSKLTDVDSLEFTKFVGTCAFQRTGLTSIKLGEDAVICNSGFRECVDLTTLELGAYLVRENAFSSCFALQNVTLTNPFSTLNDNVFDGCISLTEVTFAGTKEQFNKLNKSYKWRGSAPIGIIHCTDGNIRLKVG